MSLCDEGKRSTFLPLMPTGVWQSYSLVAEETENGLERLTDSKAVCKIVKILRASTKAGRRIETMVMGDVTDKIHVINLSGRCCREAELNLAKVTRSTFNGVCPIALLFPTYISRPDLVV